MSISKIDQSIAVIQFIIKKKRRRIDEFSRKTVTSEKEKIFMGEELDLINNVESLIKVTKAEMLKHFGKIPPQALDLEETVLGALILESESKKVLKFLKYEHFYNERHRLIFQCVESLVAEKAPIDMRTVVAMARKKGFLEQIGGAYFIGEITSKVTSSVNIEYYARVLIEHAIKRALITSSGDCYVSSYLDETDCFEQLDKMENDIKQIRSWIQ